MTESTSTTGPNFLEQLQDYAIRSSERETGSPIAREILLERTRIQDATIAMLRQAPTVTYLLISIVYSPLMLLLGRQAATPLWLIFCLTLILAGGIWWYRIANAIKARNAYEVTALKTTSDSFPTEEGMWADRLTGVEYQVQKGPFGTPPLFNVIELLIWIGLATISYVLVRFVILNHI